MAGLCRLLLSLSLAVVLAVPAWAQDVTVGAKAGIAFADLGGDIEEILDTSADSRTGFSAGAFLGLDVHRNFRLQGEAQYVRKGAKAQEAGTEATFKVDYLELLFPFTLLIPVEGGITPRLYAGPAVAFELSCKAEIDQPGSSQEVDCDDPLFNAPTKSVDAGVFFGGGIDLPLGPGVITADALYNLGLTDISDSPGDPNQVKNRNIQILLGYGIKLGR